MLNFVKLGILCLLLTLLNGCGYKSVNSDEFPHKHIQKLSPEIKNLKVTYLTAPEIRQRYNISKELIVIDYSNGKIILCLLDAKTQKLSRFQFDKNFNNQNIEEMTQISPDQYLILFNNPELNSTHQTYHIFNKKI